MNVYKQVLIIVNFLFSVTIADVFAAPPPLPIEPNVRVQKLINKTAISIMNGEGAKQSHRKFLTFKKKLGIRKSALISQMIYYFEHTLRTEKQGWGAVIIMKEMSFEGHNIIKVALTLFDHAKNQRQKKLLYGLLDFADADENHEFIKLQAYRSYLAKVLKNTPNKYLVQFMASKSPYVALKASVNSYGGNKKQSKFIIESGTKIDALMTKLKKGGKGYQTAMKGIKFELNILLQYQDWWIQLYVTQVLKKIFLQDSQIINYLVKNSHPYVKDEITQFAKKFCPNCSLIKTLK